MSALSVAVLVACAAWAPHGSPIDRRAVLSGAATAAALVIPMPAVAMSKERAREKAIEKETSKEAQQAMKEYKFAPRPELEGDAESGYKYKEGTIRDGSQGELASYFTDKGAKIQAEFKADQARASGASAEDAKKLAEELEEKQRKERQQAYLEKRNRKSQDELIIDEFCKTDAGKAAVDNVGRPMCSTGGR